MNDAWPLEGKKFDQEKIRADLLPVDSLLEISKIFTFGAKKYGDRNWEKGMNWSRIYGALLRHIFSWWLGEDKDPETKETHLAHAGCCIMFLLAYEKRGVGLDDRPNKKVKFVYIASPYTKPKGKELKNVVTSFEAANKLLDKGFFPYAPLYSHYLHEMQERPYDEWLQLDFEWLKKCDCVLRLPGESKGADREVKLAEELGKPVFYSIEDIL